MQTPKYKQMVLGSTQFPMRLWWNSSRKVGAVFYSSLFLALTLEIGQSLISLGCWVVDRLFNQAPDGPSIYEIFIKYLPQTSAVTNNPNQNVYHLPPSLCILWHPLVCLARLVFTCQLYCPAHIVFRIPCLLLCSSVLCRDYASLELGKVLWYR